MKKPKVSFVIPVRNAEPFLTDCITSITSQTSNAWEAVFVPDGPQDDGSLDILKHFCVAEPRIRVVKPSNKQRGIAITRNRGNRAARGKYILVGDADDLYPDDRVEWTLRCFEKWDADLLYGESYYFTDDLSRARHLPALPFNARALEIGNFICHSTVAYPRKRIMEYPYESKFKVWDDWQLYVRWSRVGLRFQPTRHLLAYHRVHNIGVTASLGGSHT